MTAPAVPTDQTTAPSATSLEQDLGQMFGDYSAAESRRNPTDSAAGTTPAEPAEGTEPEPMTDGRARSRRVPTRPRRRAMGLPQTPLPRAAEDDPFKDTTPAQYVVNGQPVPVEDIRVFKEGGAVIRPESLPNVLAKLAERDTLSERGAARDAEYRHALQGQRVDRPEPPARRTRAPTPRSKCGSGTRRCLPRTISCCQAPDGPGQAPRS
jgi:hypothetical protein